VGGEKSRKKKEERGGHARIVIVLRAWTRRAGKRELR